MPFERHVFDSVEQAEKSPAFADLLRDLAVRTQVDIAIIREGLLRLIGPNSMICVDREMNTGAFGDIQVDQSRQKMVA